MIVAAGLKYFVPFLCMKCRARIFKGLRLWLMSSSVVLVFRHAEAAVDYSKEVKPILADHCYRCHGGSQQKAGLRLDTAAAARKGGETGPALKPGNPAESLLIQVVEGKHEEIPRMPYKKPPLDAKEISLLTQWIQQGADAPADEKPESTRHWAFVPPQRPEVPKAVTATIQNPIDAFIRARLRKEGIDPSPEANRSTLLRRLSLDLIGLPPTPEELEAFLSDSRSDAYERQVERLLDSPHYGERWGRWWLDGARYADSNGYSIDAPRQIWKYRDWVVEAMNRDLPFDEFAIEQLAGDLLPDATLDQKIATGFNRNTQINQEGGIDPEQFRVESVVDRVNTFGTVFLGLTVGCAQCHDHKFDPITQKEYYQLFAFFNNTVQDGHGEGSPRGMLEIAGESEPGNNSREEIEEVRQDLDRFLNMKGSEATQWEESLTPETRAKLKPNVLAALKVPWSERTVEQKRIVYAAVNPKDNEFKSRSEKLAKLEKNEPKPITTLVMEELKESRQTFILTKGDFTRPAAKVEPGVPASLHKLQTSRKPAQLNRLDLAQWLFAPGNPVTARVIVNRIWQQYFGRGLVETENDFGTQGSAPSNPELLDWLACEFMNPSAPGVHPWSIKHIHRLILTSAAYRQSSKTRPDLATIDPLNHLLARQSRVRLDAEIVRDVALAASGLLSPKMGGPPVYPPQPDGVMSLGQVKRAWKVSAGADKYRRALYTHFWRATPHPALAVFDAPDAFSACTRRFRSNTPLQALTLLNDAQFYEFSEALAKRVLAIKPSERLAALFEYCLARQPDQREQARLGQLLEAQKDDSELEQWTTLARVVLNLDETITRE